ncbi:MAG TPA: peroxide stress protein YaaA [Caulobacteraceae bacterium]|nr:peroxide stress protein YaaA [Caulobacteraceae bacterium]
MLLVLSPAKSLDFTPAPEGLPATRPTLADETARLATTARRLKAADLKRLMSISDKLATLNRERFQAFDPASDEGVQAALAFDGDVYQGLDARSLDPEALLWAQDRLRILSGLYGVLRPLDRIQPYRLEMGVRLKTRRGESLYDFWGDRIAKALRADAEGHADPTVINLASQEYFEAVDVRALKRPVIDVRFVEEKDGQARVISFFAKKARGLMARWAIDERAERADELKRFDGAGYRFRPDASSERAWTFSRPQPPSPA